MWREPLRVDSLQQATPLPEPGSSGSLGEEGCTSEHWQQQSESHRKEPRTGGPTGDTAAGVGLHCGHLVRHSWRWVGSRVPKEPGRRASQKLPRANQNHPLQSEPSFLKGKMEIAIRTTTRQTLISYLPSAGHGARRISQGSVLTTVSGRHRHPQRAKWKRARVEKPAHSWWLSRVPHPEAGLEAPRHCSNLLSGLIRAQLQSLPNASQGHCKN